MNEEKQQIFINMDDSGVLHYNDEICVYGGIAFISQKAKEDFERKYKSILKDINCSYCRKCKEKCNHKCPEVKDTNIKNKHKRRIFNLIKQEYCSAIIINNKKVEESIMNNKKSRGRYRDYVQRILIKRIIEKLIKEEKIDPNKNIELIIRIDQQATSTDTNRRFIEDIEKELTKGINNYKCNVRHKPIVFSKLEIDLKYVESHKHIVIQASDLIAGETRKAVLHNKNINEIIKSTEYLNVRIFVP